MKLSEEAYEIVIHALEFGRGIAIDHKDKESEKSIEEAIQEIETIGTY